ncbi:hypothetical protein B0T13DRAFT_294874 [Neurospora crassa]|nr:hypothetical protein B0T13DRAFT_294874 [Neurospora crassa]
MRQGTTDQSHPLSPTMISDNRYNTLRTFFLCHSHPLTQLAHSPTSRPARRILTSLFSPCYLSHTSNRPRPLVISHRPPTSSRTAAPSTRTYAATRSHHIDHNPDPDLLQRPDITQPIRVQTVVRAQLDPRPQQPLSVFHHLASRRHPLQPVLRHCPLHSPGQQRVPQGRMLGAGVQKPKVQRHVRIQAAEGVASDGRQPRRTP